MRIVACGFTNPTVSFLPRAGRRKPRLNDSVFEGGNKLKPDL